MTRSDAALLELKTTAWLIFTELGNLVFWLYISFIVYWLGKPRLSLVLALGVLTTYVVSTYLKYLLCIPRPPPENWLTAVDSRYGFPSGHSAVVFFATTFLTLREKRAFPLLFLAVLVAYSRVALGVHSIYDVLGGALLGIIMALMAKIALENEGILRIRTTPYPYIIGLFIALILYLTFPTRPGLASGGLAGLLLSLRYSYTGLNQSSKKITMALGLLGLLIASLFLWVYAMLSPALALRNHILNIARALAFFAFTFYPIAVHPRLYKKIVKLVGEI